MLSIIANRLANCNGKNEAGKLIAVPKKNPAAVALGRKGGKARLKTLTPEQRSEIARKAGLAGGRGRKKKTK
jgi:hypothetical protein